MRDLCFRLDRLKRMYAVSEGWGNLEGLVFLPKLDSI